MTTPPTYREPISQQNPPVAVTGLSFPRISRLEREQRGPAKQGDVTLCSCGDSLIRLDSSELFQSLCGHDPGAKALGRLPGLLGMWFQFLFSLAAQVSR